MLSLLIGAAVLITTALVSGGGVVAVKDNKYNKAKKEWQDEKYELQKKIEELQQKVAEKQKYIQELQNKLAENIQQIQELTRELHEADRMIDMLEQRQEELESRLRAFFALVTFRYPKLKADRLKNMMELTGQRERKLTYGASMEEVQKDNAKLEGNIKDESASLQYLTAEIADTTVQLKDFHARYAA